MSSLTLLLEFFAFLRLRYVEKDTERPFKVPFGNTGAWAITIPKIIVLSGVLLAQSSRIWLFCGVFNLAISLVYLVWRHYQHPTKPLASDTASDYGAIKLS
jgi:L-asparagine transporter-like permease